MRDHCVNRSRSLPSKHWGGRVRGGPGRDVFVLRERKGGPGTDHRTKEKKGVAGRNALEDLGRPPRD